MAGRERAGTEAREEEVILTYRKHQNPAIRSNLANKLGCENLSQIKGLAPEVRDKIVKMRISNEMTLHRGGKVTNCYQSRKLSDSTGQIIDYVTPRRHRNKSRSDSFLGQGNWVIRAPRTCEHFKVAVVVEKKKNAFALINPEVEQYPAREY